MIVLETIAVAFAMFSAIPVPQPVWGPRNMRYALCALPLIGVVIGLAQALWLIAANWLCMPEMLRGAGPFCSLGAFIWTATPTPATRWPAVRRRRKSRRF